jgi:hypothetical protein
VKLSFIFILACPCMNKHLRHRDAYIEGHGWNLLSISSEHITSHSCFVHFGFAGTDSMVTF